jgi:hypothetical protein
MTKAHKYTSPFHRFIGEGEILLLNSVESFFCGLFGERDPGHGCCGWTKSTGNEHTKLNDNVLIEIGAAMALYGKKIILPVEKAW